MECPAGSDPTSIAASSLPAGNMAQAPQQPAVIKPAAGHTAVADPPGLAAEATAVPPAAYGAAASAASGWPLPGRVPYEILFDIGNDDLPYEFWPDTVQPRTADQYKDLTWGF
jgi:hypothetical protein